MRRRQIGQAHGGAALTQAQADATVLLTVSNRNTVNFTYTVGGGLSAGRNLLIDGGSLRLALDPFDPETKPVPPVPLPAAGWLLLGSVAVLGAASRLRSTRRT
jgi:hypothetical protein